MSGTMLKKAMTTMKMSYAWLSLSPGRARCTIWNIRSLIVVQV